MSILLLRTCILTTCITGFVFAAEPATPVTGSASWSPKAAAGYLDARMAWWEEWPKASRDHETFCVSCHTVAPYAMGRPALRAALSEQAPSAIEKKLLENVVKRVRIWDQA